LIALRLAANPSAVIREELCVFGKGFVWLSVYNKTQQQQPNQRLTFVSFFARYTDQQAMMAR
jgi:hypothetical protein